ncbi:hypothetical protein KOR42_07400 [Thalassoglobus neptunius]|uniref:Uncharacterized protein n=1 Tax=Thalassoglobus neptunius TaxID=1938619 RepID=A0A5C5X3F1_9PLAN|nr:hypothetical protein KOR42_07400 [Thalassoglobus neptunius]
MSVDAAVILHNVIDRRELKVFHETHSFSKRLPRNRPTGHVLLPSSNEMSSSIGRDNGIDLNSKHPFQNRLIQHSEFIMNSQASQEIFEVTGLKAKVFNSRNDEREKESEQQKQDGRDDRSTATECCR